MGDHVRITTPPFNDGRSGVITDIDSFDRASVDYDEKDRPLLHGTWSLDSLEVIP